MTAFRTTIRAVALVGALAALPVATPSIASQADLDLLASYIGSWTGRGTLAAGQRAGETVACTLNVTPYPGEPHKLRIESRCVVAGGRMSMVGTLAYIAANNRYEAVITSNTPYAGQAVGVRRGNSVNFNLSATSGENINAGIALNGGRIEVAFQLTDPRTGESTSATIPFNQ